ncbi:Neuroligin-1 [Frankliniella fusca]|uniref:Neuroligin-1 n=1 Tax=Frankliniella fusca TaxID=407009 RepID=A0AAE1L8I3_9NEOP|nr:Neuroligin-1 [Frankliniella fusca]
MRYRLSPVQCPGVLAGAVVVVLVLLASCCGPASSSSSGLPVRKISTRLARTKYGLLRGVILQQQAVEAFLGVPYATAPLGSLRYMPPVTPSMWKTPRLCDAFSPVCPQRAPSIGNRTEALLEYPRGRLVYLEKLLPLLANQSEDCLYMNIYVPQEGKKTTQFFVLFYKHLYLFVYTGKTNVQ